MAPRSLSRLWGLEAVRGGHPESAAERRDNATLKVVSSHVSVCVLPARIPKKRLLDSCQAPDRNLRRRVIAIVRKDRHLPPLVRELIEIALTNAT